MKHFYNYKILQKYFYIYNIHKIFSVYKNKLNSNENTTECCGCQRNVQINFNAQKNLHIWALSVQPQTAQYLYTRS